MEMFYCIAILPKFMIYIYNEGYKIFFSCILCFVIFLLSNKIYQIMFKHIVNLKENFYC
jgi:hypothetical protein